MTKEKRWWAIYRQGNKNGNRQDYRVVCIVIKIIRIIAISIFVLRNKQNPIPSIKSTWTNLQTHREMYKIMYLYIYFKVINTCHHSNHSLPYCIPNLQTSVVFDWIYLRNWNHLCMTSHQPKQLVWWYDLICVANKTFKILKFSWNLRSQVQMKFNTVRRNDWHIVKNEYKFLDSIIRHHHFFLRVQIQWNLSVTTTSIIIFTTCNLFSNVFQWRPKVPIYPC